MFKNNNKYTEVLPNQQHNSSFDSTSSETSSDSIEHVPNSLLDNIPPPNVTESKTGVIAVSHQTRIRTILENFTNYKDIVKEKIRFFNGAILKIVIDPRINGEYKGTVELVYPGDDASVKKGEAYFTTKNDERYRSHTFPTLSYKPEGACEPMTIYLIRHGEGEHNVKETGIKGISKKMGIKPLDAPLTVNGIEQANVCGIFLANYFEQKYEKIYFFASYLRRSQQTVACIANKIQTKVDASISHKIVILSCINEIGPGFENIRSFTKPADIVVDSDPKLSYELEWRFYDKNPNLFGQYVLPKKILGKEQHKCSDPYTIICSAIDKLGETVFQGKYSNDGFGNTDEMYSRNTMVQDLSNPLARILKFPNKQRSQKSYPNVSSVFGRQTFGGKRNRTKKRVQQIATFRKTKFRSR